MEQLLFFVNFARKHPKMLASKFGVVSHLWEELARHLNSMDGACRSADKWKEVFRRFHTCIIKLKSINIALSVYEHLA